MGGNRISIEEIELALKYNDVNQFLTEYAKHKDLPKRGMSAIIDLHQHRERYQKRLAEMKAKRDARTAIQSREEPQRSLEDFPTPKYSMGVTLKLQGSNEYMRFEVIDAKSPFEAVIRLKGHMRMVTAGITRDTTVENFIKEHLSAIEAVHDPTARTSTSSAIKA